MQRIKINNFGPINNAEIEVRQFTIVIGEQASGKTYLSKLVYFFNKLPYKLIDFIYLSDSIKLSIEDFKGSIRNEFVKLFRSIIRNNQEFKISFIYEMGLNIKIQNKSNNIEVITDFTLLTEVSSEITRHKKQYPILSGWEPKLVRKLYNLFFSLNDFNPYGHYREIYIPAGRTFMNVFPRDISLDIIRKLPDDYFLDFIRRIENIKDIFIEKGGAFKNIIEEKHKPVGIDLLNLIRQILKAEYTITENGEKLGFNTNRFVSIVNASSGQQESLRVLQDLFILFAEDVSGFRVIEEPEAHLFPTAQKKLIEFTSIIGNATMSSLFISTHSPYILSAFNNLLFAKGVEIEFGNLFDEKIEKEEKNVLPVKESWINPDNFIAYSLKAGDNCKLIFDKKTGMIDENFLDDVSLEIADEFNIMFNIYKELTSNNG